MPDSKKYPWIVVGLLWVVALLNYMDRQMLSTMRPSMQIDIAELQSAANFGNLMAIFLWIYGFASPISGIIADRINRKWLIAGSLLVWSVVTYAMGFAATFEQLYWLRAVMGVSEALYIPAGLSLIADFHSSKTRALHRPGIGWLWRNDCRHLFLAFDISNLWPHRYFLLGDFDFLFAREENRKGKGGHRSNT
jgi:MFS transporter, ACS family, D-galactonate transporter